MKFKDALSDSLLIIGVGFTLYGGGHFIYHVWTKPRFDYSVKERPPVKIEELKNGPLANLYWTVQDLDGKTVTLSAFKGNVMFLHFWAEWCGPCLEEMDYIENLYRHMKTPNVKFVCLALCMAQAEPALVRQVIMKRGYTVPVYIAWMGTHFPPPFNKATILQTFIIGRDGKVHLYEAHAGKVDMSQEHRAVWDDPAYVEFLRKLAA